MVRAPDGNRGRAIGLNPAQRRLNSAPDQPEPRLIPPIPGEHSALVPNHVGRAVWNHEAIGQRLQIHRRLRHAVGVVAHGVRLHQQVGGDLRGLLTETGGSKDCGAESLQRRAVKSW